MKRSILIMSFLLVGLSTFCQQTITKNFMHNGVNRSFIVYIPEIYDKTNPAPLLLNFHGYTMTALTQMNYCDFRPIADTAGFILLVPQGTLLNGSTHWNVGGWTIGSTADDIGFTNAMIDTIAANYNIDLTKVYSTGFSNGGFFSFELACQLGDRIAAIGSVSGSMTPETYNNCNATRRVPILQIHGTNDNTVPYKGASWTRPVDTVLTYWINHNQTNTSPTILDLPNLNTTDGSTVKKYTYSGDDSCTSVVHYQIINGGHTWPGTPGTSTNRDINASSVIWNFLSQYSLNDCQTTGITQAEIFNNILVYPNPTVDRIYIKSTENYNKLDIVDLVGKLHYSAKISENSIDLSELKAGIYFAKFYLQDSKVVTIKITKL